MNLKTTLVLLVLTVVGGVWFLLSPTLPAWLAMTPTTVDAPSPTLIVLENELTPDKVTHIEVRRADRQVVLDKTKSGDWTIAGKWLTRPREVAELVGLLTSLRSRFVPVELTDDAEAKAYGLDQAPLTVLVRADDKSYRLTLGEDPADSNRFTRATYLRLGEAEGTGYKDLPEVIRLAPGLVSVLDRPIDYYLQRRLFTSERVAKSADSQDKVERLVADSVTVTGDKSTFTLARAGDEWELKEPVRDRPDPDKVQSFLTTLPDIWAEQFVRPVKKDLAEYGLDKPQQTLTVARPGGDKVTLLVGKKSPRKIERKVMRPAPPFGQPLPPMAETVTEEFNYAKLDGNDQVFEIKADKLKDVFVALDTLRDSRLARFKSENVQRVEVTQKDGTIVLVKKDNKFRLEKPIAADAETTKVTELVDKLEQMQAKGADVIDKADLKEVGLEPPAATVAVTVEEEAKGTGEEKTKKTRQLRFAIGKHDAAKKKLYVRVDGWPRVNLVDDDLLKLVERPALAYRGRSIFDLAGKEIEQLDVQRGDEKYALKRVDGKWRLTMPVDAEADNGKLSGLAADLANLNVVEYVSEDAKAEDLDKLYGLAKPALTVTMHLKGSDKPVTLELGKQRDTKGEYFAKLASAPQVFVVRKDIHDQLDQPSLALRPLQLWQVPAGDVAALRIQQQEQPEYSLKRDGTTWKVSGPFDAPVGSDLVLPVLGNLATLRCDKYEVHAAKELDKYGLDKPYLRVVMRESDKAKEAGKERTLLIGKPTADKAKTRFAKLGDSDAVFVVGDVVVSAVDHAALDLLDRKLLKLDREDITRIKSTAGDDTLTLESKDKHWHADTGQAKFQADGRVVSGVLAVWFALRADRFAAYGPKTDLATYGLDKPARTVTISVQPPTEEGKPAPKAVEHTLALGKPVDGGKGERFARLDGSAGVAVLSASAVTELSRPYLDFVDRALLDLDSSAISGIHRKMGEQELELVKRDDGWHISKPEAQRADGPSLDKLLQQLAKLRAERVAAYPAKDLKSFGLDDPAAILTLRLTDAEGKTKDHIVKIGEPADPPGQTKGDRFAVVDGTDKVAVLPGALVHALVAKPLTFRDHALAKFVDADKAILERGPRKAVFAKVDGNWKLTEPLAAEADQGELDDFINALAKLRADELVSDKPEDLKPYGLDRPEVRWKFMSGDKEVLSLLVGDREKTKAGEPGRCYAKLATGDVVFLLDPKQTKRVLGEYRNRKLWDAIDAAQVVRLDYTAGGGDPDRKPFTLEMIDNAWHIAGKPDLKVKAVAVNDTLAALANLRAERFVVDKDADLKLYGLDPTHITVEVRTRTGVKRQLAIGSREGESKRYYARLTEGNRSDVFVLSETDAAKIVRDVGSFTEGEEKPK